MNIYDPIAEALNLPPFECDYSSVEHYPWKCAPPWNKGIPCSEEQKLIQSQKMKGRARTPEARAAISRGKKGKKRKPFSEETKQKIAAAAKKQWAENPPVRGPMSEETKRKISATKRAINSLNQQE
jgi:hypothetical protein